MVERESQKISASEGITVFPHGEHQGHWSPVVCAVWSLPLTAAELGCSLSAPVRGAPPHWAPLGLLKKSLVTEGRQVYLAVSVHTPRPSLGSLWVLPGCQPPAPRWSFSPAGPCSSQGQAIDVVDLIREVLLALLGEEAEARAADDPVDHLEVPAHAAVHVIQDHTLLRHVVFDDNDAVGAQALLAAPQELGQVLVSQVAWGQQRLGSRGREWCQARTLHWPCLSTSAQTSQALSKHMGPPQRWAAQRCLPSPVLCTRKPAQKSLTQGLSQSTSCDRTLTGGLLGPARHLCSSHPPCPEAWIRGSYQPVPSLIRTPDRL